MEGPVAARAPTGRSPIVHLLLVIATGLTMTLAGGLPFALTLMAILLSHEAGHYLMCRHHGVRASLPYLLPGPPLPPLPGTFGAFIRIRSPFPDRRALFDVGAAGPWAGFVVAVAATVVGLVRSEVLPELPERGYVMLGDSLLTGLLARAVLGVAPDRVLLDPVAYAGWFGFLVTALNLLPVGQLDGGHVLYAAGRGRGTRLVPAVLIALLVWLGARGWSGWLVWGSIAVALMALGHPATRDDGQPLGAPRQLAALATLVLLVLTFVPEPLRLVP